MEEATLRAKIQAMKNLLEVKRKNANASAHRHSYSNAYQPHNKFVRPNTAPVNRSWTRFPSPAAPANRSVVNTSANKVWRREGATPAAVTTAKPTTGKHQQWKKPVKVAANKPAVIKRTGKSMHLQVLRLEDGEYAKAKGGFSLVRAGVKKPAPKPAAASVPVSRSKDSVNIGGVKYVLANEGKVLKRCSSGTTTSFGTGAKSVAARAALARAKTAVQRARTKRFKATKKGVQVRTEYCSFYNRFGFCKNKNECRFIHDSRRVAMCRKFLRNECNDPKCLLSHQNDENKVPVCKMFLRGSCTREDCKYRHVKVSATAELCKAFAKGYCPKGDACEFKHELQRRPRPVAGDSTGVSSRNSGTLSSAMNSAGGGGSSEDTSPSSTSPFDASSSCDKTELSIRPSIRFAPKHNAGFSSLFEGFRRASSN